MGSREREGREGPGLGWPLALVVGVGLLLAGAAGAQDDAAAEQDPVERALAALTLEQKVGQMSLRGFSSRSQEDPAKLADDVRRGEIGALINVMNREVVDLLQRVAVEESPGKIPILFGRDVIHGFRTIFPIPLGQAATWNPSLVEKAARISAQEASTFGIRWTFAPMVDITRDPRWGRIAESPGEDPYLAEVLAVAMVRGFQGEDLTAPDSLAACAKHFAAYGAAIGGRDYNTVDLSEPLLRNVYLRPFEAAHRAGALTFMTAFNEVNGVPATGDPRLLRQILRQEWGFRGMVVSDWESVTEMIQHGFAADTAEAAERAVLAGLDLEMTSEAYGQALPELVRSGRVPEAYVDQAVRNILRVKATLGLFDSPHRDPSRDDILLAPEFLNAARETSAQSVVLLQNRNQVLPLDANKSRVAVIGPLADAPHEQLGTWTFDGRRENTRTPRSALTERLGEEWVLYAPGLGHSRDRSHEGFAAAVAAAEAADVVLFFGGEEAILSGEAHSRADLRLPGAQEELIKALESVGKPLVLVVLAGRPLDLEAVLDASDAVMMAWHPGTMGGPALADLLLGDQSPSGRLPVTWPKTAGQVPIYYNHKNTGRPAPPAEELVPFDEIPIGAWQSSLSNTSRYLDLGADPRFPFGFGLTYSRFEYSDLEVGPEQVPIDGAVEVSARIRNVGSRQATEVVQLYSRDLVASLTRPVRELKGFQRVDLGPGEETRVRFTLPAQDLGFYGADGRWRMEPGEFRVWIAPHAAAGLEGRFEVR